MIEIQGVDVVISENGTLKCYSVIIGDAVSGIVRTEELWLMPSSNMDSWRVDFPDVALPRGPLPNIVSFPHFRLMTHFLGHPLIPLELIPKHNSDRESETVDQFIFEVQTADGELHDFFPLFETLLVKFPRFFTCNRIDKVQITIGKNKRCGLKFYSGMDFNEEDRRRPDVESAVMSSLRKIELGPEMRYALTVWMRSSSVEDEELSTPS